MREKLEELLDNSYSPYSNMKFAAIVESESGDFFEGVNIENGKLIFNVTSGVGKNVVNCKVDQNNRIINFSDNECIIKPILLIDNNDIEANHSAYIGEFNYNDLFYLMSRGINKDKAYNLLVKGFLLGINKNDVYLEHIDKYWR